MSPNTLLDTIDRLIGEGREVLATDRDAGERGVLYAGSRPRAVDVQRFAKWQAGCGNLLRMLGEPGEPWKEALTEIDNAPNVVRYKLGTLLNRR
jgi:hypothetical protein